MIGILSVATLISKSISVGEISGHGFIYFLIKNDEIVYVGQTVNIESRLYSHLNCVDKDFDSYNYIKVEASKMDLIESIYIHTLSPSLNAGTGNSEHITRSKRAPISLNTIIDLAAIGYEKEFNNGQSD